MVATRKAENRGRGEMEFTRPRMEFTRNLLGRRIYSAAEFTRPRGIYSATYLRTALSDSNAYRFQWQCTLEHEKSHINRAVCPHNGLVLTIPNPRYTNAADECIANKVSLKCLNGFEGACASILNMPKPSSVGLNTIYFFVVASRSASKTAEQIGRAAHDPR